MTTRPTFIDIDSRATSAAGSYRLGGPEPRVQHYDGEIPPSLSPLDAIAAHSRKLAKELEETRRAGQRRMSRLPPHIVTESLTQHQAQRPQCFRSLSGKGDGASPTQDKEGSGSSPKVAEPEFRPLSEYTRISGVPNESFDDYDYETPIEEAMDNGHHPPGPASDYFGASRVRSPEPAENTAASENEKLMTGIVAHRDRPGEESTAPQPDLTFRLAPPNAAFAREVSHSRPNAENSDDDYTSSNAGSTFSINRKLSSSSGMSVPQSPASPFAASHRRISSKESESGGLAHSNSRLQLNFSMPLGFMSMTNLRAVSPSRQQSNGSQTSQPSLPSSEPPMTPTSFSFDEPRLEMGDGHVARPSSSYTYGKYSLPRGRNNARESKIFDGLTTPDFKWQEPMFPSSPTLRAENDMDLSTPSPPQTSRSGRGFSQVLSRTGTTGFSFDFGAEQRISRDVENRPFGSHSPSNSTTSAASAARPSVEQEPLKSPPVPPMPPTPQDRKSASSRSNSTIRPQTSHTVGTYQTWSAEDHVAKGIELHQNGDLKESTYHLRIAAKQNHPTGMLLYALACRHGWGMRSNQKEGVMWLRKAVDSAMLEVADDEATAPDQSLRNIHEKKAHRAQFALSVYELGVSHLNGWGIEQDKSLALRCFEIAGHWGDVDALTEAGFCYAEGIGCKKNLRKAAKFYRLAESKGASMVGNSWIHKPKYDEKDGSDEKRRSRSKGTDGTPSKPRSKSKTKSIFTRKKSSS